MAGIYIHIPFCKQACTYCNFHFSTSLKLREKMVEAIVKEMKPLTPKGEKVEDFSIVAKETIETIYFGGGTPSILLEDELQLIFDALYERFEFADEIEGWVLEEFKKAGLDTAKSVLEQDIEDLIKRTDLEEETILSVRNVLKAEFSE